MKQFSFSSFFLVKVYLSFFLLIQLAFTSGDSDYIARGISNCNWGIAWNEAKVSFQKRFIEKARKRTSDEEELKDVLELFDATLADYIPDYSIEPSLRKKALEELEQKLADDEKKYWS